MCEVTPEISIIKIRASRLLSISIDLITGPTQEALTIPSTVCKVTESKITLHSPSFREDLIFLTLLWCFLHPKRSTTWVSRSLTQTSNPTTKITWTTSNPTRGTVDQLQTFSSKISLHKCWFKTLTRLTIISRRTTARKPKRITQIGKSCWNNNKRSKTC